MSDSKILKSISEALRNLYALIEGISASGDVTNKKEEIDVLIEDVIEKISQVTEEDKKERMMVNINMLKEFWEKTKIEGI